MFQVCSLGFLQLKSGWFSESLGSAARELGVPRNGMAAKEKMGRTELERSPWICHKMRVKYGKMLGQISTTMWTTMVLNLVGGAITILKNMTSSMGRMTSHILWKIKHAWNHQPVILAKLKTYLRGVTAMRLGWVEPLWTTKRWKVNQTLDSS